MDITKHPITGALLDEIVFGKAGVVEYFSNNKGEEGILIDRQSTKPDYFRFALYETFDTKEYHRMEK